MCITEGFPALPFVINEDISTEDGAVQCRQITGLELAQLGWKALRLLRLLRSLPFPPP